MQQHLAAFYRAQARRRDRRRALRQAALREAALIDERRRSGYAQNTDPAFGDEDVGRGESNEEMADGDGEAGSLFVLDGGMWVELH